VPTAAIAYSLKVRGVFDSCGQADGVFDARTLTTPAALDGLWRSWTDREDVKVALAGALPGIHEQAERQMDAIVEQSSSWAVQERRAAP
jgi:hypothetical protein